MKVLTPGHKYELAQFEEKEYENFGGVQTIQFIEKVKRKDLPTVSLDIDREPPVTGDPEELITLNEGTTNEEVLRMMIDRLTYLNNKFPCRENSVAITKLDEALMWLEKRTKDRVKRGVEGKAKA